MIRRRKHDDHLQCQVLIKEFIEYAGDSRQFEILSREKQSSFVYEDSSIKGLIEWVDQEAFIFLDKNNQQLEIAKKLIDESLKLLHIKGRINLFSPFESVVIFRQFGFVPYAIHQAHGNDFIAMQKIISPVKLRSETMYDFEVIDHINNHAFGQEGEAQLIRNLRKNQHFNSELSILAVVDQEAVGHILFTEIMTDRHASFDLLALAPLAVCPNHQDEKIGSSLIIEGLRRAYNLGYKGVVVLGYSEYYSRFGFKKASDYDIKCPFPVPEDAYMVYPLVEEVAGIQGTVIYPDAFMEV